MVHRRVCSRNIEALDSGTQTKPSESRHRDQGYIMDDQVLCSAATGNMSTPIGSTLGLSTEMLGIHVICSWGNRDVTACLKFDRLICDLSKLS